MTGGGREPVARGRTAAGTSAARDRILERVRGALADRARIAHPGAFEGWRRGGSGGGPPDVPTPHAPSSDAVAEFVHRFEAAGGRAVRVPSAAAGEAWLAEFSAGFDAAATGQMLPKALAPPLPSAPPEVAPLGVSMARCAVAETGSLMLDARDGRRTQLLPPTHVVWVRAASVYATLREALLAQQDDLPSALGLHSGPSKSADIGQILVEGVHGPGRVIALIIDERP